MHNFSHTAKAYNKSGISSQFEKNFDQVRMNIAGTIIHLIDCAFIRSYIYFIKTSSGISHTQIVKLNASMCDFVRYVIKCLICV